MVAVRCPRELTHILQRAGAVWEPGSRRWLVERRRIGPVIRTLDRWARAVGPDGWRAYRLPVLRCRDGRSVLDRRLWDHARQCGEQRVAWGQR